MFGDGAVSISIELMVVSAIVLIGLVSMVLLLVKIQADRKRAAFVEQIARKSTSPDARIQSVFRSQDIDAGVFKSREDSRKTGLLSFSAMSFDLDRAGLPKFPVAIFALAGILAYVTAVVVFNLPGVSIGLQATLLYPVMFLLCRKSFIGIFIEARRIKMIGQMIDFLEYVRRAAMVGYSTERSIIEAIDQVEDPLRSKLMIIKDLSTVGSDFIDSLHISSNQIDLPEYDIFVAALEAQASAGGSIAGVLGDVVDITRLRLDVQRKIATLTAEGRFNALLLGFLPIVLMLYVRYSEDGFFDIMWESQTGYNLYILTIALAFVGAFVAIKIANVKL